MRKIAFRLSFGLNVFLFALTLSSLNAANAETIDQELAARGKDLVTEKCSKCHAILMTGDSPFAEAPPFRKLATAWNPESLAEAFAEGIVVGHPDMPQFVFEPDQIGELIEYFKSLRGY